VAHYNKSLRILTVVMIIAALAYVFIITPAFGLELGYWAIALMASLVLFPVVYSVFFRRQNSDLGKTVIAKYVNVTTLVFLVVVLTVFVIGFSVERIMIWSDYMKIACHYSS